MQRYLCLLATLLLFTIAFPSGVWAKEFVVVIDPGHGGGDIGTPRRKCKQDEKTIALNVALRLGRLIEGNYSDVRVVYTRKNDRYPSLPDRTQIAKKAKGDLFISIHVNACPTASVHGFETFVFGTEGSDNGKKRLEERLVEERENLDINGRQVNFDTDIDIDTKILCQAQREKHNKQSLEVANHMHQSLLKGMKQTSYSKHVSDRGIKAKNLFVLCYSPMPAVLVELGYMSNPEEEKFINSDEAQGCFAQALYNGFKLYKRDWDKRQLSSREQSQPQSAPQQESRPSNKPAAKPEAKSEQKSEAKPEPKPETKPEQKADTKPQSKPEQKPHSDARTAQQETKPNTQPATVNGQVTWKIQFLSSDRLLKEGDRELKGLKPVSYYKVGKLYKYTYGSASSSKALNADLQKVKKLFPEAFYVKFDAQGNRIK